MDYLERKYRGKRKENVVNTIYILTVIATAVAAGLLIYGYFKEYIIDKRILYLAVFTSAFIMCVTLAVRAKILFKYERIVWLAIEALVFLIFAIISLLVLV